MSDGLTATTAFSAGFEYDRGVRFIDGFRLLPIGGPEDRSKGDCDDFAVSMLYHYAGGVLPMLGMLLRGDAALCLVRSAKERGGPLRFWPTHMALWIDGEGYIDSTHRQWRDDPDPHALVLRWRYLGTFWVIFRLIWGATIGRFVS